MSIMPLCVATEIPTIIDPNAAKKYHRATGSIIVGISVSRNDIWDGALCVKCNVNNCLPLSFYYEAKSFTLYNIHTHTHMYSIQFGTKNNSFTFFNIHTHTHVFHTVWDPKQELHIV